MKIKLSAWAKQAGISFKTAQRWFYDGKMPVPTTRTPTGRIMVVVDEPAAPQERTVLYVASNLGAQADRLRMLAAARGWTNVEVVADGPQRKRLLTLLGDPTVRRIVAERPECLVRFDAAYLAAALKAQGREVVFAEVASQ